MFPSSLELYLSRLRKVRLLAQRGEWGYLRSALKRKVSAYLRRPEENRAQFLYHRDNNEAFPVLLPIAVYFENPTRADVEQVSRWGVSRFYGGHEAAVEFIRSAASGSAQVALLTSPQKIEASSPEKGSSSVRQEWILPWRDTAGAGLDPSGPTGFRGANQWRSFFLKKNSPPLISKLEDRVEKNNRAFKRRAKFAVVLHLYYPEMFEADIKPYLNRVGQPLDLFVSLNPDVSAVYVEKILEYFPNAHFTLVKNVGRDVAPFLRVFPTVASLGYAWVCKIHSKKSLQHRDGDFWREFIFSSLLQSKTTEDLQALPTNVGLAAPTHQLVDLDIFLGENSEPLDQLISFYNLPFDAKNDGQFAMGTMFWFRPLALEKLLEQPDVEHFFAIETNALDGTYAHAYERLFGLLPKAAGYHSISL